MNEIKLPLCDELEQSAAFERENGNEQYAQGLEYAAKRIRESAEQSEDAPTDEALAQIAELGYAVVDTSLKCIGHSEQSLARQEHEEAKAQLREAVETVRGIKQAEDTATNG